MSGLKSGWLVPLFRNESHRGLFVSSAVPYLVTVGTSSVLLKVPERFKNSPQKVPILSLRPKCCLCDSLSPSPTVLQKKRGNICLMQHNFCRKGSGVRTAACSACTSIIQPFLSIQVKTLFS